ncbi:MAG TPA: rhodanese-like domain-containing protein [Thermoanaerobaculia bacterium]|nr:rhodanese-like domain-containing protein [Thermoanaerobaculia bacterium]
MAYEIVRDSPEILILDLRPPEEFRGPQGHVRGAINIEEDRLRRLLLDISAYRDQTFLVYCGDASCGEQAMEFLMASGYRDAILIEGGFRAWVEDGFDTVLVGEEPPRQPEPPPAEPAPTPPPEER